MGVAHGSDAVSSWAHRSAGNDVDRLPPAVEVAEDEREVAPPAAVGELLRLDRGGGDRPVLRDGYGTSCWSPRCSTPGRMRPVSALNAAASAGAKRFWHTRAGFSSDAAVHCSTHWLGRRRQACTRRRPAVLAGDDRDRDRDRHTDQHVRSPRVRPPADRGPGVRGGSGSSRPSGCGFHCAGVALDAAGGCQRLWMRSSPR